jgi:hypothetical protein
MALLVLRRLAVRQSRVHISARHQGVFFPTKLTGDEEIELYEYD